MSLSAVIDSMLASGCSREQIAAAVKADEAERLAMEAARLAAKRLSGAQRQRRKRKRDKSSNVTPVTRDARDIPLPVVTSRDTPHPPPSPPGPPPYPPPSEPRGSGSADAPPLSYPADPVDRLWAEGLEALMALGVEERSSRSNIGRWMRDTGNDAVGVLAAIIRARSHSSGDPIALVSRILKPTGKTNGIQRDKSVVSAADRLIDGGVTFGPKPVLGTGEGAPRLLSQR